MAWLHIGGAQCVHADFSNDYDTEDFDYQLKDLQALAASFNVHIDRKRTRDQGRQSFVVMHQPIQSQCFYEGAAFEANMNVACDNQFPARALDFIAALNRNPTHAPFHGLQWSDPNVLYFVTS